MRWWNSIVQPFLTHVIDVFVEVGPVVFAAGGLEVLPFGGEGDHGAIEDFGGFFAARWAARRAV